MVSHAIGTRNARTLRLGMVALCSVLLLSTAMVATARAAAETTPGLGELSAVRSILVWNCGAMVRCEASRSSAMVR